MEEIWKPILGYEGLYEVSNLGRIKSFVNKRNQIIKGNPDKQGYLGVALWKDGKRKRIQVHRIVAIAFLPNPDGKSQVDHVNTDKADNRVENLRWVTPSENQNNPITIERIRGKKATEETKEKIRQYALNRSEETRHKMSESSKRENLSLETRQRMSEAQKGKKMPEKTKTKISLALKGRQVALGRKASEETKRKMSLAHKGKTSKPVLQYSMDGEFIREWSSINEAAQHLMEERGLVGTKFASNISTCCNGGAKSAYGYVWKHVDHTKNQQ